MRPLHLRLQITDDGRSLHIDWFGESALRADNSREFPYLFDLLCGADLYKFHCAEYEYTVHKLRVMRRTPLILAAAFAHPVDRRFWPVVKRALIKTGLYRPLYRID